MTEDKEKEIYLPERSTVKKLIDMVSEKYGEKVKYIIIDSNTGKSRLSFFVNGKQGTLNTKLENGDEVAFMIFMSGG